MVHLTDLAFSFKCDHSLNPKLGYISLDENVHLLPLNIRLELTAVGVCSALEGCWLTDQFILHLPRTRGPISTIKYFPKGNMA